MKRSRKVLAGCVVLVLSLDAHGRSASLPSNATLPTIAVPRTSGTLAVSDIGRRPPTSPVGVTLVLRYNNQAQLDQFVATQSAPGGAHLFLTAAQFDSRYAPTAQQEQGVVYALQAAGFTVTHRYANRTVVDATAPSSTVERFFSTQMHNVQQGKYGQRYTNMTPGTVPSSIAAYVRTASLSNVVVAEPKIDQDGVLARTSVHASKIVVAAASPAPKSAPASGCNGAAPDNGPLSSSSGTLATGVATPFDFPVQHGCNGAGYTAAVVIDDPVDTSYVSTYLAAAGVTQTGTITNEAVDGGGSGDDPETDLDVQTISGLAPGANIIVYDIGSLADQNIEDAYNQVLSDGKASAVNSSFGGCESSDPSLETATNAIAEQGAAEGVEFSASSGDTGSDECGNFDQRGVEAPAGDPYFTSIGGVNFAYNSSGVLTSVTAGDAQCGAGVNGVCYGGGGVSTTVAIPSWQSGIPGTNGSGRNQPDISLPFDYVAVYSGGSWAEYLGTSWSSPASVALFIEADELHGQKLGWVNPTLYSLFSSTKYSDYYTPCTSGNNIAYSCNATEYNQAAGIGAPKGWALANAL
jgi:subtilase family serine protease